MVFWHSFTQGPRAEYMERMAEEFETANPDVNITIETFSWGEFQTKWTTGLAAGQVPDLSTALPNQVVQMINVGALAPVDDVIDGVGRERFAEAALGEGTLDGVSYSLPIYSHAQVMWYRSDLLEAAGLDVPETWDELLREARIAIAARRLALGDDPVARIAADVGMPDANYFARSFRETLRVSPSEYRRLTAQT